MKNNLGLITWDKKWILLGWAWNTGQFLVFCQDCAYSKQFQRESHILGWICIHPMHIDKTVQSTISHFKNLHDTQKKILIKLQMADLLYSALQQLHQKKGGKKFGVCAQILQIGEVLGPSQIQVMFVIKPPLVTLITYLFPSL